MSLNLDWMKHGACADIPELTPVFFSEDPKKIEQAKAICATCPVRLTCLNYAIKAKEPEGVWGGQDTAERRLTRRRRLRRKRVAFSRLREATA